MKQVSLLWIGLFLFSATALALETAKPPSVEGAMRQLPYDAGQTLQTFTKTVHGGVQHVVVKSTSADQAEQIKLIQDYLRKLTNEFRKGDFSETERMHGTDLPGLSQLKTAKTDDIAYEYRTLPDGAQIHYTTEYPQYVQALHEWFDAQMQEHGNAVIPEHMKHHLSPAE